jgi:hypothetical protein
MRIDAYSCDVCGKHMEVKGKQTRDEIIFIPLGEDRYHHLCVSCANKNISDLITGLYPQASQMMTKILLGEDFSPEEFGIIEK